MVAGGPRGVLLKTDKHYLVYVSDVDGEFRLEPCDRVALFDRALLDRHLLGEPVLNRDLPQSTARSLDDLFDLLGDPDYRLALDAVRALGDLTEKCGHTAPILASMIRTGHGNAPVNAVRALAALGACADVASQDLEWAFEKGTPELREWSMVALSHITPTANQGVQYLIGGLSDPSPLVRRSAVRGLSSWSHAGSDRRTAFESAVPKLKELAIVDPDRNVRRQVQQLLRDASQRKTPLNDWDAMGLLSAPANTPVKLASALSRPLRGKGRASRQEPVALAAYHQRR